MKTNREYLFAAGMLVVMLLVLGGVYQFYFKARLEEQEKNLQLSKRLEAKLTELEGTFSKTQPDVLVKAWNNEVQPWEDAVVARAPFYNMGDFLDIEEPPEESMLKFYYDEKMRSMLDKLKNDAYNRQPPFIYQYETTFGAARMADFAGRNMAKADVRKNLKRIKFADSMVRMLMNAKVVELKLMDFWPAIAEFDEMLGLIPVGIHITVGMKDLAALLDSLRMNESRYFTVCALSVQNTNLLTPTEPLLDVQLLLLQAYFIEKEAAPPPAGAPSVAGAPGAAPVSRPWALRECLGSRVRLASQI